MARRFSGLNVRVRFFGYRLALVVMYCLGVLRVPRRVAWYVAASVCWIRLNLGGTVRWYRLASLIDAGDL